MTTSEDDLATLKRLERFFSSPEGPRDMLDRLGCKGPTSYDSSTGRVRVQFLAEASHCHSHGKVVQGGFVAGWLDNTMANAVFASSNFVETPVSLDLNVSYFLPAAPGIHFADAWVVHRGRSTAFLEAELFNAEEIRLAKATSTVKLYKM